MRMTNHAPPQDGMFSFKPNLNETDARRTPRRVIPPCCTYPGAILQHLRHTGSLGNG